MTTKEQERKALAQIRKIVESLGEDSYVGDAFEGCFEIAEENIDNDMACSMKSRADMFEEKAERLEKALAEMTTKLTGQIKATEINHETAKTHIADLEHEISLMKKKALPDEERCEILRYLGHRSTAIEKSMASTADMIADMSDNPSDAAFTSAVKSYKEEREEKKLVKRMIHNLLKANG